MIRNHDLVLSIEGILSNRLICCVTRTPPKAIMRGKTAATREAATAATQQSRGAEDLAAAIEEIATLADEMKQESV